MGMIEPSGVPPGGREEPNGRPDDVAPEGPRAFSHDSHFSVSVSSAHGYRLHMIDEIIVIGANGQIIALERPELPAGRRRRTGAMPVPVTSLSRAHDPLRFLWGPRRSVLGPCQASSDDADHHLKFRALHHRVLEGVGDIALQAFIRFLERGPAWPAGEFPAPSPQCKLAFRFQYDEHYLHERHAAQLAWKRFLMENAAGPDQTQASAKDRG